MAVTTSKLPIPTILTWSTRLGWVATAVALSQAIDGLNTGLTATISTWLLWVTGAVAVFVGSPLTLTLARTTLPLSIPVAVVLLIAGANVPLSTVGLVASLIASYSVFTAEVGQRWVQFAAYGAERRLPLCAPLGFAVPAVVLWVLVAVLASYAVVSAEGSRTLD